MFNNLLNNPIALVFISYMIGALLTTFIQKMGLLKRFDDRNYLDDTTTKWIGALHLGWIIRKSWLGGFNKKLNFSGKMNRQKLQNLKHEMTMAEVGHLMGFTFLLIVNILYIFWKMEWWYILVFFVINVIANLYLVFLQQYNKRRIDRLINNFS